MKLTTPLRTLTTLTLTCLIASTAFAAEQFYEVGKSYLFVPRINMVLKGTVTQITDQEIVFDDIAVLKASKAAANVRDDAKSGKIKSEAVVAFLKSKNRDALLEPRGFSAPTSYSRSALTAVKID